ncbi:hypothetical protein R0J88_22195, partial [Pseudoalteromonas sp. SIMBA_162]
CCWPRARRFPIAPGRLPDMTEQSATPAAATSSAPSATSSPQAGHVPMALRIGHGFDVHRFGDGDNLMISGVNMT